MKRQIVFRGKRTDTGEWVEGFLVISHTSFNPNQHCIIEGENHFQLGNTPSGNLCFSESNTRVHKVHPESVGQFTGLTDRNGKMVFEGDALMCDGYLVVIQFTGGQFVGRNDNYSISETQNRNWLSWEIIGNIHDNPGLIKQ